MESLGRKLREAREKHNYNLEQIARDTNISKGYLEALEEENFGVIPGDTYVLGFLRNYGEYLGLNPEELVGLYRNLRIQEQPMPMSELLQGPRRVRPRPRLLALILVVVAAAAVGVFLLVRYGLPRGGETAARQPEARPAPAGEYVLSEEAITRWYSQGETVSVPMDGEHYRLSFAAVGDRLTLKIPGGTVDLAVGQTRQVDLDGDLASDIRAQLNDLDVTGSNRRANVSIYKLPRSGVEAVQPGEAGQPGGAAGQGGPLVAGGLAAQAGNTGGQPPGEVGQAGAAGAGAVAGTAAAASTGSTGAAAAGASQGGAAPAGAAAEEPSLSLQPAAGAALSGPLDLQAAGAPEPFRLSISFRGYVLLRYLADGETRDERFFHKGETFALDVKREARLWISNAGALRLSVGGKDVELGRPGEVVTRTIRWAQSPETGGYRLQVLPSD
jgi:cytoskeletal protein RodZ